MEHCGKLSECMFGGPDFSAFISIRDPIEKVHNDGLTHYIHGLSLY